MSGPGRATVGMVACSLFCKPPRPAYCHCEHVLAHAERDGVGRIGGVGGRRVAPRRCLPGLIFELRYLKHWILIVLVLTTCSAFYFAETSGTAEHFASFDHSSLRFSVEAAEIFDSRKRQAAYSRCIRPSLRHLQATSFLQHASYQHACWRPSQHCHKVSHCGP